MTSALHVPPLSLNHGLIVGGMLMLSSIGAWLLTPDFDEIGEAPLLENIIPAQFGEWKQVPSLFNQVGLTADKNEEINQLYDRVLMRTYVNKQGEQVMLALAYAKEQKQDIKIHRPEVCYVAQGYQLLNRDTKVLTPEQMQPITAQRLLMRNQSRSEAVTYWIRIGDEYPVGGLAARLKIMRDGLQGKVVDGILVRASTVLGDESEAPAAYVQQEKFLDKLLESLPVANQTILAVS